MLYRRGNQGPAIVEINQLLYDKEYLDSVDDVFDEATEQAVKWFQEDAGLKPDGLVGPLTWNAMFPPKEPDSVAIGIRPPLQSQLLRIYGRPNYGEWRRKWITFISLEPFRTDLNKVREFHTSAGFGVVANKTIQDPLYRVFKALLGRGLLGEITSCGGAFNIRPMKGRTIPSVHSYGLAIDLNVPQNPYNKDQYSWSDEFAQTWAEFGWEWGYIWDKPIDSMHFQWAWTRNWSEYEQVGFIPRG